MKIHSVGAELFHAEGRKDGRTDGRADRRTDMTKLIVVFRNFTNAPKSDFCKIEIAFSKSVCACA